MDRAKAFSLAIQQIHDEDSEDRKIDLSPYLGFPATGTLRHTGPFLLRLLHVASELLEKDDGK